MLERLLAFALAAATLFAVSCGDNYEEDIPSDPTRPAPIDENPARTPSGTPAPMDVTSTEPTPWVPPMGPDSIGWSVDNMLLFHDLVVIGNVIARVGEHIRQTEFQAELGLPGDTYAVWAIDIADTLHGEGVTDAPTITVYTFSSGTGEDGRHVSVQDPFEVGKSYLLFLLHGQREGLDGYWGLPLGRFAINDAGLVVPNGYEYLEGISQLSGLSADERSKIFDQAILSGSDPYAALPAYARVSVAEAQSVIVAAEARILAKPLD